MSFTKLGLKPELLRAVEALGFESPMPIQSEMIPQLLNGDRDCIALASTGSGKTAAFGLPMLNLVTGKSRYPQFLILSPTRELCMQISADLRNYAKFMKDVRVLSVYGGANIKFQMLELYRGVSILVATPGRLLDLMDRGSVHLETVRGVVLDEADEMLNMGFQEDLEKIMDAVPESAHTWMFSATMEKSVSACAHRHLKDPIEINVVDNQPPPDIKHVCMTFSDAKERGEGLRRMIEETPEFFGLVFRRTRSNVRTTAKHFADAGYSVGALHGDLTQGQRDKVMKSFRNHEIQMLFATDVAARGIDVSDVTHIVHFDISPDAETYTHRSGRTARAGKSGVSVVFAIPEDHRKLSSFERTLKVKFEYLGLPHEQCVKSGDKGGESRGREKSGRGGQRNWSSPSRIQRKYGKSRSPKGAVKSR